MSTRSFLAATVFSLVSLPLLAVNDGQRLALIAKPAVVRIIDGYEAEIYHEGLRHTFKVSLIGIGSGSFIDRNGYIATNAHVAQMTHDGDEAAKQQLFPEYVKAVARAVNFDLNRLTRADVEYLVQHSTFQALRSYHLVVTPSGESFPFEIKAYGAPVGEGKDVAIIKVETKNAPILKVGDSDQMHLQDHVTVIGYPGAAETTVLDAKSLLEASITDGKISARKTMADGAPVLQISAPTTHGNSGGPVLNDQGEVVGLLTFRGNRVNQQEVQGFNFVVAASTMQEFIKQAGANNTLGPVDTLWREGLDLFARQEYTLANKKFEEVRRLYPKHPEAERILTEAEQQILAGHDRSAWRRRILLAGGLFSLVAIALIIGLAVFFARRRKKQAAPAYPQPPQYAPRPQYARPQPSFAPAGSPQMPIATTVAPIPDRTVSVPWLGTIQFTAGLLAGQSFEIGPSGAYIGRDPAMAQIVINDGRVSKRHVWVGPKNGGIVAIDVGSTNGTFLNVKHSRIQETAVHPGDVVIVSDDIARFQVHR